MMANETNIVNLGVVNEALALAGIPADSLKRKQEDLPSAVAALHRAILRSFAEQGGPPSVERVRAEATALDVDPEIALEALTSRDLIVREPATGEITGAYPFSGTPTPHRVRIHGGMPVYAMCAIDALGIPFMLGCDAEISSEDPIDSQQVRVERSNGEVHWQPPGAVVFVGSRGGEGSIAQTCCSVINFFGSVESAEQYQRTYPNMQGRVLSQAEAVEAGRQVFERMLSTRDGDQDRDQGCAC